MFELPASKRYTPSIFISRSSDTNVDFRVRRADLNRTRSSTSPPSSRHSTPDPELQSQAQARFAALFGDFSLPEALPATNVKPPEETTEQREVDLNDEGEEEQGFEFRLFSNPTDTPSTRIVLEPEDDNEGDGRFVRQERDRAHYFATPATGDRKIGFETMAVSGETVLAWRNIRARGLEVPWRVNVIKIHSSSELKPDGFTQVNITVEDEDKERKKCKPNKKRRVILREKQRKKEKAEEEKRKRNEGKEAAEREKKTRLNRAKKVKRKMKEKAIKAGDGAATITGATEDVDMSDGEK